MTVYGPYTMPVFPHRGYRWKEESSQQESNPSTIFNYGGNGESMGERFQSSKIFNIGWNDESLGERLNLKCNFENPRER